MTTADDSGAIASGRGVRVLVTPMGQTFQGYSGISYLGSFGTTGLRWNTVLVFPDALGLDQTKGIVALKAQMNTDLLTEDLKKARWYLDRLIQLEE